MGKLKLSLIADERSRKITFMKRKNGVMKNLHELTTLCGVQACGVIYSPYLSAPEAWPSKEGVEEVALKFMKMSTTARTQKMMNQETYLQEKIAKVKEQVDKVALENQELELKRFMFDCLEGKMSEYHYGPKDLDDLHRYINHYIDQLTRQMQILVENGESSSLPPLPVGVADTNPLGVADFPAVMNASATSAANEFYDHIQYMNQNQQDMTQHHTPINSSDIIPYQNMNMNQNQQELVQYQAPPDFYDHTQQGIYNNMSWNQDMNYMNQQQSFMNIMVEQQMGHAGGLASIPFMDGNLDTYHQATNR